MTESTRIEHWQRVYITKHPSEVSWYEAQPTTSLQLIERAMLPDGAKIIDVGSGASTLVDALFERYAVTVLDLSHTALQRSRDRLGANAHRVAWRAADITQVDLPARHYDLWHDRAAFHFLTDPADRSSYLRTLRHALKPGGHLLLATFAPNGPMKCSGLEVVRYDAADMLGILGAGFKLLEERLETHLTPSGGEQRFAYGLFECQKVMDQET